MLGFEDLFPTSAPPNDGPKVFDFVYKRNKELVLLGRVVFFRFFGSGHQGFAKPSSKTAKPNPKTRKPNPETTKPNPDPRNAAPPVTGAFLAARLFLAKFDTFGGIWGHPYTRAILD